MGMKRVAYPLMSLLLFLLTGVQAQQQLDVPKLQARYKELIQDISAQRLRDSVRFLCS